MMALGFPPTANLGPTWVTTVVGVSFSDFGWIALGWGSGALIASALLTRFPDFDQKGILIAGGVLLFAASFVVFAIGTSWHFAVVGNVGLGAGMATSQVASTSLIAAMTPNKVRGRVMSLLMLNMGVAQALTLPVVAQAISLETLFPILGVTSAAPSADSLIVRLWRRSCLRTRRLGANRLADDVPRALLGLVEVAV